MPEKDLSNWFVVTFQIFRSAVPYVEVPGVGAGVPGVGVPGREELLPGIMMAAARLSVPGCQESPSKFPDCRNTIWCVFTLQTTICFVESFHLAMLTAIYCPSGDQETAPMK